MERFEIRTSRREELIDVTSHVIRAIARRGTTDGIAVVYCPHTTAGITVNENADPDVVTDVLAALGSLAPASAGWRHREGNADAHVKATIVGCSATIPIVGGRLALGTWQGVYLCEFDGPRTRSVVVTAMAGDS